MLNNVVIESFIEVMNISAFQFLSICCFFANCVSCCCFISPFLIFKRFQDHFRTWGMTNGTCENELPAKTHGTSFTQTPNY